MLYLLCTAYRPHEVKLVSWLPTYTTVTDSHRHAEGWQNVLQGLLLKSAGGACRSLPMPIADDIFITHKKFSICALGSLGTQAIGQGSWAITGVRPGADSGTTL
jgi:hypothetical protein